MEESKVEGGFDSPEKARMVGGNQLTIPQEDYQTESKLMKPQEMMAEEEAKVE